MWYILILCCKAGCGTCHWLCMFNQLWAVFPLWIPPFVLCIVKFSVFCSFTCVPSALNLGYFVFCLRCVHLCRNCTEFHVYKQLDSSQVCSVYFMDSLGFWSVLKLCCHLVVYSCATCIQLNLISAVKFSVYCGSSPVLRAMNLPCHALCPRCVPLVSKQTASSLSCSLSTVGPLMKTCSDFPLSWSLSKVSPIELKWRTNLCCHILCLLWIHSFPSALNLRCHGLCLRCVPLN